MKGRLIRYSISGLNQTTAARHSWSDSKCCDSSYLYINLKQTATSLDMSSSKKCQIIPSIGRYDVW